MNFLVTNDDGWDAVGIERLAEIAAKFGTVTVIAPAKPQSGISHQLTLDRAMDFVARKTGWHSLDGTPADCVRYGLHHLNQTFDLVLSGINHGANLGVDVFTSGTVAAAREANFHGVSAVAFSQYRSNMAASEFNWDRSADWSASTFEQLLKSGSGLGRMSDPTLINVNLPDPASEISAVPEMVECQTDLSPLPIEYRKTESQVHFSGRYQDRPRAVGQDIDICFGGRISISHL